MPADAADYVAVGHPADAADYIAVGHVTADLIVDAAGEPRRQPGGGAFYSALQAARLGLRTLVLTTGVPHDLQALLEPYTGELNVLIAPAAQTTTLATRGSGAARRQRLLAWAGPIPAAATMPASPILHFAPIARELSGDYDAQAQLVALTPQGLARRWQRLGGELDDAPLDTDALPRRCDAVVMSETERPRCEAIFSASLDCQPADGPAPEQPPTARPPVIAVTAGPGPTTLYLPDGSLASVTPPRPAALRDDLGAGDVFAAAFFVALVRGEPPERAAAFGHAAAAVRIEGNGPDAIGDQAAIAAML